MEIFWSKEEGEFYLIPAIDLLDCPDYRRVCFSFASGFKDIWFFRTRREPPLGSPHIYIAIDEIVVQDSRRQTRSLVLFHLVQKIPNCLNKNLG